MQPGEWRTLGLVAALDGDRLEEVLASMPLRVWRTDEVTPLSPHPNDPPPTPTSSAVTATETTSSTLSTVAAMFHSLITLRAWGRAHATADGKAPSISEVCSGQDVPTSAAG